MTADLPTLPRMAAPTRIRTSADCWPVEPDGIRLMRYMVTAVREAASVRKTGIRRPMTSLQAPQNSPTTMAGKLTNTLLAIR